MELTYRSSALIEDLAPGECTVHRASVAQGGRWWLLWMRVYREDRAGVLTCIAVPVAPHGSYTEGGPGGRTWGLMPAGGGRWQVSPSVDAKVSGEKLPGFAENNGRSLWHQTPALVGVPDGEAWQAATP